MVTVIAAIDWGTVFVWLAVAALLIAFVFDPGK